jgi:hydrogenase expression/formation protein HypE
MKKTCDESEVSVITGDTKVMERGALDKLVINTSGIGVRAKSLDSNLDEVNHQRKLKARWLLDTNLRAEDKIIVTGTIGDHGIALLSYREGYDFQTKLESDVKPLNKMVEKILKIGGIVKIKDPTRGGLSNTLNEWSEKSNIGIKIKESQIPIREDVKIACEMLGIDPIEVGNEGKLVLAVLPEKVEEVLRALRTIESGLKAEVIGEVVNDFTGVIMETLVGGDRIIPAPMGDPIPRIC